MDAMELMTDEAREEWRGAAKNFPDISMKDAQLTELLDAIDFFEGLNLASEAKIEAIAEEMTQFKAQPLFKKCPGTKDRHCIESGYTVRISGMDPPPCWRCKGRGVVRFRLKS